METENVIKLKLKLNRTIVLNVLYHIETPSRNEKIEVSRILTYFSFQVLQLFLSNLNYHFCFVRLNLIYVYWNYDARSI
jgi:hypothetical protein